MKSQMRIKMKKIYNNLKKMKRKMIGLEPITEEDKLILDMNGDVKITITDLLILKRMIVGLIK